LVFSTSYRFAQTCAIHCVAFILGRKGAETDSTQNYKSIRDILSNDVVTDSYAGFANATPLTINYYDNYNFLSNFPSTLAYQVISGYDKAYPITATQAAGLNATGLLTGTRTYFLDGSGSNITAMYYDDRGRAVQTLATNQLGGYDLVYNQYDFLGKPLKTYKTHGINGTSDTYKELYSYAYDNGQRLKTTTYSLNGAAAITLVSNNYDELGRLQIKTIGNGIDVTNYIYNIQGNITDINGTNFSENLYYNTNIANLPNFTSSYNGNIAGMKWSVPNEQLGYQRAYSFAYDDLNRLTNSVYSGNNSNQFVSGTLDKYNEKLDYQDDKMGKLKMLTRYENGALVENLSLSYQGNQLQKVDNSLSHFVAYGSELFRDYDNHIVIPREYAYDTNGNMLYDANNGVSDIEYNVLNLPDKIHFTAGHKNQYIYDAGGQKLRIVNYSSNRILDIPMGTITPLSSNPSDYTVLTTDYVGNMIYENGALKEILLPEGYYQNGTFYYYLKDHLGDNRVTINSSGAVVERSHYYPSGTRFFTESTNNDLKPLPYRYNGKELEAMNGLNQMDYGARRRFSWAPIWTSVDPLAEKYYSISPYAYCAGNPVRYIDADGREKKIFLDPKDQANTHIINAANKYKDDDAIHIWAHGTSKSMIVFDGKKEIIITSAKQLDKFLLSTSEKWQNKGKNENMTIILHSCETGKDNGKDPSFAREVSKDLKNTNVIAATEKVVINDDTDTEIGTYSIKTVDVNGKSEEALDKKGNWVELSNGKETENHPGDWQPSIKPEILTGKFSLIPNN